MQGRVTGKKVLKGSGPLCGERQLKRLCLKRQIAAERAPLAWLTLYFYSTAVIAQQPGRNR
jgi:hypothetical protein